jgi:hypothetical protein
MLVKGKLSILSFLYIVSVAIPVENPAMHIGTFPNLLNMIKANIHPTSPPYIVLLAKY